MILDEFVEVKWHNSNKAHYENLGYVFTKIWDEFKVRPTELQNKSNVYVTVKCDTCGNVYSIMWLAYIAKKNKQECPECCSFATKTFDFIHNEFAKRGYDLLTTSYTNSKQRLEYRCRKHPEYIQKTRYSYLQSGFGCRYCGRDTGAAKQIGRASCRERV